MNELLLDRSTEPTEISQQIPEKVDGTSGELEVPRTVSAAIRRALGIVTEQMVTLPSKNKNYNGQTTAFNSQQ